MKQPFALPLILGIGVVVTLITTLVGQVQGGIITNQQSLTLPDSLVAAATAKSSSSSSANETSVSATDNKNGTRSGRVMYTASYSNVRIASKEPKSMDKYFPIPAVISKKSIAPVANIVPVLPTTTTSTTTTTTSTTTTSTTTVPPPPSTSESVPEELPEIIEVIMEETDPMNNDDEVVTETVRDGSAESTNEDEAVTEPTIDE